MKYAVIASVILTAVCTNAFAVDFSQEVRTFDDKSFTNQSGTPTPVILGDVVEAMLLNPPNGTADDEKRKRFFLALKIHDHRKDPLLTNDELKLVRKAAFDYPVLSIAGQSARLVDPGFVDPNEPAK
jgi:hypothetical protein